MTFGWAFLFHTPSPHLNNPLAQTHNTLSWSQRPIVNQNTCKLNQWMSSLAIHLLAWCRGNVVVTFLPLSCACLEPVVGPYHWNSRLKVQTKPSSTRRHQESKLCMITGKGQHDDFHVLTVFVYRGNKHKTCEKSPLQVSCKVGTKPLQNHSLLSVSCISQYPI